MQKLSLDALGRELLEGASSAGGGRKAQTVYGGHEHVLRQTLIALGADKSMAEHNSPGESTVLVLSGRVSMVAGDDSWSGRQGDLLIVPPKPHRLDAVEDSVVLLTVAKLAADSAGDRVRR